MAESSTASNGFVIPRSSNLYKPKEEEKTPDYTSSIQYRENERNPMRTKAYDAVRQAGGNPNAARIAAEAVDFVPGVGEAAGAIDVAQSLKSKEYLGAGLNTAALAVGTVPVIGDAAGKGLRAIARKIYKPKVYTRKDGSIIDEKDADLSDIQEAYKLEKSQRQIQTPQLKEAAQLLKDEKINKEIFDEIADTFYPSKLITKLPEVPIPRRIEAVVAGNKAKGNVITPERSKELAGQKVSTRLDIPAYNDYNTWVVTVASPNKTFKSTYGESANLTKVVFGSPTGQAKALKIATGGAKTPFAVMEGTWKNKSTEELALIAQKHLANPAKSDWIQVGMNPYKHSYFYDKASMLPVISADEVIQIGSLVLAKGTKYGKKTDYKFIKGGTMEELTIGLQDEGGMIDEESGNEVPNGALKEEVRDDQPAMLSPGEFVIPAYAVRYIGVERLVKLLREAKQGMEQLDDIGLTGEPNADDAGLATAMLPSDMQEGEGSAAFAVGGLQQPTGVYGANLNRPTQQQFGQQQFGQQQFAAPTQQQFAQPAAFAPSSVLASPLSAPQYKPTVPIKTDKKFTYPEMVYTPGPTGPGYGVAEYVGPDGKSIFITTVGGKPLSKIPFGFKTRDVYDKDKAAEKDKPTAPPTAMVRQEEVPSVDSFEPPPTGEEGDKDLTPAEMQSLAEFGYGKGSGAGSISLGAVTGGPLGLLGSILNFFGDKAARSFARSTVSKQISRQSQNSSKPPPLNKLYTKEEVDTWNKGSMSKEDIAAVQEAQIAADAAAAAAGSRAIDAAQARADAVAADPMSTQFDIDAANEAVIDKAEEAAGQQGIDIGSYDTGSAPSFDAPSVSGISGGEGYGGAPSGSGGFGGFSTTVKKGGLIEKRKTTANKKKNSKGLVNKRKALAKKKKKGKGLASSK
jgi:hypothetical protein